MTPEQKQLVQSSFAKIMPTAPAVAELFYARLFELDPSVKPMFKGNMAERGKKLMSTIGMAVGSLSNLDALRPLLQDLGRGHIEYGVKDSHYDTVGMALLWALEKALGDEISAETQQAWAEVYTILATIMKYAAAEAQAA